MNRADVVLVDWPYSDRTGSKLRPAVVVQADYLNGLIDDTVLVQVTSKAHGIPGQVAMEQVMACGLGPCYVCVRTFEVDGKKELRRVCIEGPVFDLQEAVGW